MAAPLYSWPWQNLGSYKNLLYGPFLAQVIYSRIYEEGGTKNVTYWWCLHLLMLWSLRGLVYQIFNCFSNTLFLNQTRRINRNTVNFKQIDIEWDWDNFLILQAFIATVVRYMCRTSLESSLPQWNKRGAITALLLHVGISEPLYYIVHRCFHRNNYLFKNYHSLHHQSTVPQSFTAANATFLEHLILSVIVGIPVIGSSLSGNGSVGVVYGYVLVFDFMRCLGHCNLEFIPHKIFHSVPFLRYIFYTPTYHNIHHEEKDSNFCLFMPVFDAIGNTLNSQSWELHKKIRSQTAKDVVVPDFVFLGHVVDLSQSMHPQFFWQRFSSVPFRMNIYYIIFLPTAFLGMLAMWIWAKTFTVSCYNLRGRLYHTWSVPRYGFQYFLKFAAEGINKHIEDAILNADKIGVKVISLAALNKNEALNGGGTLFVNKHQDLRVRVVHGNTLTAAVILNDLPKDVTEVFLSGATSKLGRSIALYLCQRKVRVLMLTLSTERFQNIQKEAPLDCQQYLVQVTKYQAAKTCKTWIVGKWITPREQNWAPPGTHFHQFVVPPIFHFRRDCTYGDLAAMRLPDDVQGLGYCEYTMERGVVHACHAGGVVHFLEGWTHHEVGPIEVDRIDIVWEAAMKHGFKPLSNSSSSLSLNQDKFNKGN